MLRKAAGVRASALAALLVSVGCVRYHVMAPDPDPIVTPHHVTVTSLFWGLGKQVVPATGCARTNALDQVQIHTTVGHMLLRVITLGIVSKARLTYQCSKPKEAPGVITLPPDTTGAGAVP